MKLNNNHLDTSCQLFICIYFQAQRSWLAQSCVNLVYSSCLGELKPPIPAPDLDPRLDLPGEIDLPAWGTQRSPGCVIVLFTCVVYSHPHNQIPIPNSRHKKARTKSG